ncbi:hypothetical protein T484DRAFT_3554841 [Baffinella frigidus]|nr:hypothetical protein T484DRAFT_3554841 [Cryptophyta sp. CCMP2293]
MRFPVLTLLACGGLAGSGKGTVVVTGRRRPATSARQFWARRDRHFLLILPIRGIRGSWRITRHFEFTRKPFNSRMHPRGVCAGNPTVVPLKYLQLHFLTYSQRPGSPSFER